MVRFSCFLSDALLILHQKADNVKHRERWAKVKESAKRKKESRAATESNRARVQERIEEDPEGEEASTKILES